MSLVEQELLTIQEHLSSPLVFSGIPVTRSLVLCVGFMDRCLSLCIISFSHCVACSSIYGFWLPLWNLQTLLVHVVYDSETMLWAILCKVISQTRGWIVMTPLVSSNSSWKKQNGQWTTQVLAKQILYLIRQPPCYSYN